MQTLQTGVPQKKLHANGVQNPLVGAFSSLLLRMERKVSSAIDETSNPLFQQVKSEFNRFLDRQSQNGNRTEKSGNSESEEEFCGGLRRELNSPCYPILRACLILRVSNSPCMYLT